MASSTLLLEVDNRGVATLTLNRPQRHNALDATMIAELQQTASMLAADSAVRVVVLTGAGASFCAGGDLDWMRQQMTASRMERIAQARLLAEMLNALNTLPKPLIGKAQGAAYGGGVGLLCVCDVALAADTARFGLTETRLGLIPATIGPYVIARLGEAMARRVFMSARIFDAAEAMALGIVARTIAPGQLDAAVEAEVVPYLAAAPGAVSAAKTLARRLGPRIDAAVIEASVTALADVWETEEAREGLAAFFDKRKPGWAL
ncbi:crotonase/enoyl-CoA hydratase family protein [Devosia sp.]|uniref:crotonase/enoyl-CoA hydratase family protein n=1 Tax=Devosia sp. TaxID=1871048 RepID=UPI002FC86F45